MRTALYCRVSTEDQGEKYSLPAQIAVLTEAANRAGEQIVGSFIDECSGANVNRPQFQGLLAQAKAGMFDKVRVFALDRFSRDIVDAFVAKRMLETCGVKLDPLNVTIDDTPAGEFNYGIHSLVAQMERKTFMARSRAGKVAKAQMGGVNGTSRPFGYDYVGKQQGSKLGHFVINEEQGAIVRRIFNEYAHGAPLKAIARGLNADGVQTRRGNGSRWTSSTVRKMLLSSRFIGQMHWAKGQQQEVMIACPPIIDEHLFYRVQAMLLDGHKKYVGRPSRRFLLRGLLWCAVCGRRCLGRHGNGWTSYKCGASVSQVGYPATCSQKGVTARYIERAVISTVWNMLRDPKSIAALFRQVEAASLKSAMQDSTRQKIERLAKLERRYMELAQDPELALDEIRTKILNVRAERMALEAQIGPTPIKMPPEAAIRSLCARFAAVGVPDLAKSYEACREMLESIECRVTVRDAKQVTIQGNIPFPVLPAKNRTRHEHVGLLSARVVIPFQINVEVPAA